MGSAHHLSKVNIFPKFDENLSEGSGDMKRTCKCYGKMDGQTKGIPITSFLLRSRGLQQGINDGKSLVSSCLFFNFWNYKHDTKVAIRYKCYY